MLSRHLRAAVLVVACSFVVSTAAVEAASLHPYPTAAKTAFLKGCTRSATSTLCKKALVCIQRKLTYSRFIAAGVAIGKHRTTSGTKIVRSCGRAAVTG